MPLPLLSIDLDFADRFFGRPLSPEERLLLAVFKRAVEDSVGEVQDEKASEAAIDRDARISALEYLFQDGAEDGPHSMASVAEFCNCEVEDLRRPLRKLMGLGDGALRELRRVMRGKL